MARIYTNFAKSTLLSSITSGDTSVTVASGDGALFPAAGAGSTFDAVIFNTSGVREVVSCTSRTGDVLTITRAQQGTTALAWSAGDRIGHRLTAAALNSIAFADDLQEDSAVWCGTAGGTANALTLTPSPAIAAYTTGQRFRFKAGAADNSGTTTVAVSGLAAKNIYFDALALGAGQIIANKYYEILYDGTQFELIPLSSMSAAEDTAPNKIADFVFGYDASAAAVKKLRLLTAVARAMPWGQGLLINGKIVPSVGSSALTLAVKGDDDNDPSATNPVYALFRKSSLTDAGFDIVPITAALSVVVSSGSTLGHASNIAQHVFVYLINNAGAAEVAVSNLPPDYPGVFGKARLVSTTAEGGAGAADSATGVYSTTARTNAPWICVAKMLSTQTTAGTWAANMTQVDMAPFSLGPVVAASQVGSNHTVGNATFTVVQYQTAIYDTDSMVDTGNYRIRPKLAGYYRCRASWYLSNGGSNGAIAILLRKNGSELYRAQITDSHPSGSVDVQEATGPILLNGCDDYIDAACYQSTGGSQTSSATSNAMLSLERVS